MKKNLIVEKSYEFALKIINFYKELPKEYKSLYNQILRSWTSIGANVTEWDNAQSKKDFLSKMWISYKEANETRYRLKLFKDSDIWNQYMIVELLKDIEEIIKILSRITKTTKESLKRN